MKRTTAPGSSGGLYVDDNPALGIVGTLVIAEDKNITQEEMCNVVENSGLTLSGSDDTQMSKAIFKMIIENRKPLGEIYAVSKYMAPIAYTAGNEANYFPGLCLTDFESYKDISVTNWPLLVPYLRERRLAYRQGLSGEALTYNVVAWAIAGNIATLTFALDTVNSAVLSQLAEDANSHGGYTNWRTITLSSAIGNIVAGTYAITNITPTSRTLTFAYTAVNAFGSVSATAEFYQFRIAGSTTAARVFSARGLALHGVNDDNAYLGSSLRRRGHFQGHYHASNALPAQLAASGSATYTVATGSTTEYAREAVNDGTNGAPRVAKETNSPALGVHLFMHGGVYEA